ncbi:hypothetical protein CONPUDRAFT_69592 [Coniophora puteana RWD-64-598 SS2]|uniref:Uncharacterized protein n=1 Tax=Coniophora puteana (strain RWD-64-598) TaxID=741705 RepID=A0A5M3N9C4_CONPW|nr:uncharacterized protein CONPUDRAFT_69592 [Coniophora puteana RWD-64-598 SS2]EIW87365.1 hypothetical protein CONPUDRAFT_69592 [Coniophora puteana RWD-64-598 SS2]
MARTVVHSGAMLSPCHSTSSSDDAPSVSTSHNQRCQPYPRASHHHAIRNANARDAIDARAADSVKEDAAAITTPDTNRSVSTLTGAATSANRIAAIIAANLAKRAIPTNRPASSIAPKSQITVVQESGSPSSCRATANHSMPHSLAEPADGVGLPANADGSKEDEDDGLDTIYILSKKDDAIIHKYLPAWKKLSKARNDKAQHALVCKVAGLILGEKECSLEIEVDVETSVEATFRLHSRTRPLHSGKWTSYKVLDYKHVRTIRKEMRVVWASLYPDQPTVDTGDKKRWLGTWSIARKVVARHLTCAQWDALDALADRWNISGPPDDVQEREYDRHFIPRMKTFMTEAARDCGVQLSALWVHKNAKGQLVYGWTDELLKDVDTFKTSLGDAKAKRLLLAWANHNDPDEVSSDDDGGRASRPGTAGSKRDVVVALDDNGYPLVPSEVGCNAKRLQKIVREVMRASFRYDLPSSQQGACVPWSELRAKPLAFISPDYLPRGSWGQFDDPSKMLDTACKALIRHWRLRQNIGPDAAFRFLPSFIELRGGRPPRRKSLLMPIKPTPAAPTAATLFAKAAAASKKSVTSALRSAASDANAQTFEELSTTAASTSRPSASRTSTPNPHAPKPRVSIPKPRLITKHRGAILSARRLDGRNAYSEQESADEVDDIQDWDLPESLAKSLGVTPTKKRPPVTEWSPIEVTPKLQRMNDNLTPVQRRRRAPSPASDNDEFEDDQPEDPKSPGPMEDEVYFMGEENARPTRQRKRTEKGSLWKQSMEERVKRRQGGLGVILED